MLTLVLSTSPERSSVEEEEMISGLTIKDTKSYELFYEEREQRDDSKPEGEGSTRRLMTSQDRVRPERREGGRQRERDG
jgi:hypothetical protein